MGVPTLLPTMRYDPDREAVWVWPEEPDPNGPFLVTRHAIEDFAKSTRRLTSDELIDACEHHLVSFAAIAARKLTAGDIDPDGHPVVMELDVNTVE